MKISYFCDGASRARLLALAGLAGLAVAPDEALVVGLDVVISVLLLGISNKPRAEDIHKPHFVSDLRRRKRQRCASPGRRRCAVRQGIPANRMEVAQQGVLEQNWKCRAEPLPQGTLFDMGVKITGVRHVKVWVADLARSRAWYSNVFDLEQFVEFEDSDGVVRGLGFRMRDAGFSLMLREDPHMAEAMQNSDPFALAVRFEDLAVWGDHLDRLGIWRTEVIPGSSGHVLGFRDPDGIQIRLYAEDPDSTTPAVFRTPNIPQPE